MHAFLGLVRYIAVFLPNLAEHTRVLTQLTAKNCDKVFPVWTTEHELAFRAIKKLVVGADCLITIDHDNPGENHIFVTCDASDWRTGAVLSFGKDWESARPVAFESQLNSAQRHYPTHEKELLAIIRVLAKWRVDLLGTHITIVTDHKTLEAFDTQRDLSKRQCRWQEFLGQYDYTIKYVLGEDNTALSQLPDMDDLDCPLTASDDVLVASILSIAADDSILNTIREGYRSILH